MSKAARYLKHSLLFAFGKSAAVLAPLVAASAFSTSIYGMLEWGLSASIILGVFLSLGSGGVIAFEIIRHERSKLIETALFYASLLSFIFGAIGITLSLLGANMQLIFLFGFTGIFIAQFSLSAFMKAKGMGAYASIVESSIYIIILLLSLYALYFEHSSMEFLVLFPSFSIIFSLILFYLNGFNRQIAPQAFLAFLKKGSPIMISGLLAISLVNLPRVLLEKFGTFEDVANFSLYFRWAAIALIIYQFALVVNFRKIYKLDFGKMEQYITLITLSVYLFGFAILLFIAIIKNTTLPGNLALPSKNTAIQTLMLSTISLWSLSASLEGIFYKENSSRYQTYAALIGIVVFLLIIFLFHSISSIVFVFSIAWFLAYCTVVAVQLFFLQSKIKRGCSKNKSRLIILFVFIVVFELFIVATQGL